MKFNNRYKVSITEIATGKEIFAHDMDTFVITGAQALNDDSFNAICTAAINNNLPENISHGEQHMRINETFKGLIAQSPLVSALETARDEWAIQQALESGNIMAILEEMFR